MSALVSATPPPDSRSPLPNEAALTDVPVWRLSVERYHAMIDAGILTSEDRVELLEGVLVFRMSVDELHVAVCGVLNDLIAPLLDATKLSYRSQAPVTLKDGEPEPDGAIANGQRRHFAQLGRKPFASEVSWVAEVANTSLKIDRGVKLRSYARANIPTYWIVVLEADTIEVYTDPDPTAAEPTYRTMTPYRRGQRVPVVVNGTTVGEVAANDILG